MKGKSSRTHRMINRNVGGQVHVVLAWSMPARFPDASPHRLLVCNRDRRHQAAALAYDSFNDFVGASNNYSSM